MKKRLLTTLLAVATVAGMSNAYGKQNLQPHTVLSCPLADGDAARVKVASGEDDGVDVLVEIHGKTERAFPDEPAISANNHLVLSACVKGALIFAVDYGPPYRKGMAIRANPATHEIERIHFSEKALPEWLYQDNKTMVLVIPNEGHETDKKYLIYQFLSGKGESPESTSSNRLPKPVRKLTRIPAR